MKQYVLCCVNLNLLKFVSLILIFFVLTLCENAPNFNEQSSLIQNSAGCVVSFPHGGAITSTSLVKSLYISHACYGFAAVISL